MMDIANDEKSAPEVSGDLGEALSLSLAPEREKIAPENDFSPVEKERASARSRSATASPFSEENMQLYWDGVLTGDPDTIPSEVRKKAGADEALGFDEDDRNEVLMSAVNRSWLVDHARLPKEEVMSRWGEMRRDLARSLRTGNTELEVFTALSADVEQRPLRQMARKGMEDSYLAGLCGKTYTPQDWSGCEPESGQMGRRLEQAAHGEGAEDRERYIGLAESIYQGVGAFRAMEEDAVSLIGVAKSAPGLWESVGALAHMSDSERAKVYRIVSSMSESSQEEEGLLHRAWRSFRRGSFNMGYHASQAGWNLMATVAGNAGERFHWKGATDLAEGLDKRLRILEELRRLSQHEMMPLDRGEEASLAERLVVDAAGATPAAVAAFAGGPGFAVMTLDGVGAAIAEARQRAPQGSQTAQMTAGIVGGAVQASIYAGMSRIGGRLLERSINAFQKARGKGVGGFSLAGLKALAGLTGENAKLLLAGKAAEASSLGLQELAARVTNTASNIDWSQYGDNMTDVEMNLRQSAMNLPFILIGSGRVALRHFHSRSMVLGDGSRLLEWGIPSEQRDAIVREGNIDKQGELLHLALSGSRRWSAPQFVEEAMRALNLFNTAEKRVFNGREDVRDFLRLPSVAEGMQVKVRDPRRKEDAEELIRMYGDFGKAGSYRLPAALSIRDEWLQKSRLMEPESPYRLQNDKLQPEMRNTGFYVPGGDFLRQRAVENLFRECHHLSYRFLLNTNTMDDLLGKNASLEQHRSIGEKARSRLMGVIADSVMRYARGESMESVVEAQGKALSRYYYRKHYTVGRSRREKAIAPKSFRELYEWAYTDDAHKLGEAPPELVESMRVVRGIRNCSQALATLLPRTADFRTMMTRGYTPLQAYAAILRKHLEIDDENGTTFPPMEVDSSFRDSVREVARENEQRYELYRKLTGRELECETGEGGLLYWRLLKPNGLYTHWHEKREDALNDWAANSSALFLPFMDDSVYEGLATIGSELRADLLRPAPNSSGDFTNYDQLCGTAMRDLSRYWVEDVRAALPGFSVDDSGRYVRGHQRGDYVTPLLKVSEGEHGPLISVDRFSMATPLSLIQARFEVYWRRMLSSGWYAPEEVGGYLERQGVCSAEEVSELLRTSPKRGRVQSVSNYAALARRMAGYMSECYLSDLSSSPLPGSVKEWFAAAPFMPREKVEEERGLLQMQGRTGVMARDLLPFSSRHAAVKLQDMSERLEWLRDRLPGEDDAFFHDNLRLATGLDEAQSAEQAWCFNYGGQGVFDAMGQQYWNLLRYPARGWELLPEGERGALTLFVEDACRENPAPAALEAAARGEEADYVREAMLNLEDVLAEYPELRLYSPDPINRNRLMRINMGEALEDWQAGSSQRLDVVFPKSKRLDYQVENNLEIPSEFLEDNRRLPALSLLGRLRAFMASRPYAAPEGIVWNRMTYGGLHGSFPPKLGSDWVPHCPMEDIVETLDLLAAGEGEAIVCGVPVKGVGREELSVSSFENMTIYRRVGDARQIYRLMPGDQNSPFPQRRSPYVVHSHRGYLMKGRATIKSEKELDDSCTPLPSFVKYRIPEMKEERLVSAQAKRLAVSHSLGELMELADESKEIPDLRETMMRLFEDSGFNRNIKGFEVSVLRRGEALGMRLARLMLLVQEGVAPQQAVIELREFARTLREDERMRRDLENGLLQIGDTDALKQSKKKLVRKKRLSSSSKRKALAEADADEISPIKKYIDEQGIVISEQEDEEPLPSEPVRPVRRSWLRYRGAEQKPEPETDDIQSHELD